MSVAGPRRRARTSTGFRRSSQFLAIEAVHTADTTAKRIPPNLTKNTSRAFPVVIKPATRTGRTTTAMATEVTRPNCPDLTSA